MGSNRLSLFATKTRLMQFYKGKKPLKCDVTMNNQIMCGKQYHSFSTKCPIYDIPKILNNCSFMITEKNQTHWLLLLCKTDIF